MRVFKEELGTIVRDLRHNFYLTQRELCEGICTQSFISQLENGEISVSAEVLYQLSIRFGVDINYLYETAYVPRYDYYKEVFDQSRILVELRDYEELSDFIVTEEKNPLIRNAMYKQFILWHKGILQLQIQQNNEEAINLLNQAALLSKTANKTYSEKDIEILISKVNVYLNMEVYNEAVKICKEIEGRIKLFPLKINIKIQIRTLYILSQTYTYTKNYKVALNLIQKGINLCTTNEYFNGLGEFYFLKGVCYRRLGMLEDSIKSYNLSRNIFSINKKEKLIKFIEKQLEFINNEIYSSKLDSITKLTLFLH